MFRLFRHALVVIVTISLMLVNSPVIAQQTLTYTVAWIFNGQLWVSINSESAEMLVETDVVWAALSPQQHHIAYVRDSGLASSAELVILNLAERKEVVALDSNALSADLPPDQIPTFSVPVWIDEATLVFNTLVKFPGPPGVASRDDLQRLDLDGTLTELASPGTAGAITISPNRHYLAVTAPGSESDGFVQILEAINGQPVTLPFSFASVLTGSEIHWTPRITWKYDSSMIGFAIPDPELLYADLGHDLPPTQVCTLTIDDERVCTEVLMAYPAQPIWDDDLSYIAYAQPDSQNANLRQLVFGRLAREQHQLVWGHWLEPVLWLDDDTLLFQELGGDAPGLYMVRLNGGAVEPWMPDGRQVRNMQIIMPDILVLATGDHAEVTVGLYETRQEIFTPIASLNNGHVLFSQR